MNEIPKPELIKIVNELAKLIPPAPSEVTYAGVRLCNAYEDIRVIADFPRWYRHPDEYKVDDDPSMMKKMMRIQKWEDDVFQAIETITKKFKVKIEQSA